MRKSPADFEEHWDYREPQPGDQLRVERTGYYHHGIYAGDGRVIHFNGGPDAHAADVEVQETDISEFLRGGLPEVRVYSRGERKLLRKPAEILAAARAALGRHGYHVLRNNCEHFSNECAFGVHYSKQTDSIPDGEKLDMHRSEPKSE